MHIIIYTHDTPYVYFTVIGSEIVGGGGSDDHGEGSGDLGDEGKSHMHTHTHIHTHMHIIYTHNIMHT